MRIALIVTAACLGLAGCSSAGGTAEPPGATAPPDSAPTTHQAAEPRTDAGVRAAAQEEFDSYSSGDYGGAWDVFSAAGQRAISRANYQRLLKLCPPLAEGVRFNIERSPWTATIRRASA
ncbi:hypothetical protein GCM10023191_083690 [Actinoallomurus oryzae]|uniref:Uncharacterized protein n=1 Tax=Actinoallomurus oryzae TaxID=502180 RepID=A0ABP8R087_9ACTN